jgi:hypothetical protein
MLFLTKVIGAGQFIHAAKTDGILRGEQLLTAHCTHFREKERGELA